MVGVRMDETKSDARLNSGEKRGEDRDKDKKIMELEERNQKLLATIEELEREQSF